MNEGQQLHEGVQIGDLARVEALIAASPGLVTTKDWNADTPLHLAAYFGYREIVEFLLLHHADVNAVNSHGKTPLHRAAFNGHKDIAWLLLLHGARVDATDNYGETPLAEAMMYGYSELVELLRQHGGPA